MQIYPIETMKPIPQLIDKSCKGGMCCKNKINVAESDQRINEKIPPKVVQEKREEMVLSPYFSEDALSF